MAVFTQPDRPAGRGQALKGSPVKRRALALGLPVHQPATLKTEEARELLASLKLDLLIVAAYGLILPPAILEIPRLGCINIHASLLPRWRGAAPIQRALLAGDASTGVTIMRMEAGLDTGPMLASRATPISEFDTGESLQTLLARLGADLMVDTQSRAVASRSNRSLIKGLRTRKRSARQKLALIGARMRCASGARFEHSTRGRLPRLATTASRCGFGKRNLRQPTAKWRCLAPCWRQGPPASTLPAESGRCG